MIGRTNRPQARRSAGSAITDGIRFTSKLDAAGTVAPLRSSSFHDTPCGRVPGTGTNSDVQATSANAHDELRVASLGARRSAGSGRRRGERLLGGIQPSHQEPDDGELDREKGGVDVPQQERT